MSRKKQDLAITGDIQDGNIFDVFLPENPPIKSVYYLHEQRDIIVEHFSIIRQEREQ